MLKSADMLGRESGVQGSVDAIEPGRVRSPTEVERAFRRLGVSSA